MVDRIIWFATFLLALAMAWCTQLGDTGQRMAVYQLSLVVDCPDAKPNAGPVRDAALALESSLLMSQVVLYGMLGMVLLAGAGLSRVAKDAQPPAKSEK